MATHFSKDELIPPSWVDKAFFARALRSYKRDASIEVQGFKVTPGTAAGEHFASVMFKVAIDYSSKDGDASLKVILKTVPEGEGFKADFLKTSTAFKSEAWMYSVVLPEMERVLRIAGDSTVFAPTLVYQNMTTEAYPVIVFEDVSTAGFRTFQDAIENWEHIQLIVRRLAKFHALSIYLNDNGCPLTQFDENFWTEGIKQENHFTGKFLKPTFLGLVKAMGNWEGFEELFKKVDGQYEHHSQAVLDILRNPISFSVLNHGDFNQKNMMYRNEGLKDEDLLLIDFQFPMWSTPQLDISYIYNIMIHDKLGEERHDEIQLVYYREFRQTLKNIKYQGRIPGLLDLKLATLAGASIDVLLGSFLVPPRFFNWRDTDLEKVLGEGADFAQVIGKQVYENPEYREFVRTRFRRLEATGVLDY